MDFAELIATWFSILWLAIPLCFGWAAIEIWLEERGRR